MPMKWKRGQNPYVHSYFGRLRLGPNVLPIHIAQQAKQLKQSLGSRELELGNQKLDEHAISEAATKLMKDPAALAQELLLVHPLPREEGGKLKKVCEELRQVVASADTSGPLPLRHPRGLLWFVPPPGPEIAELPAWEEFGLAKAGSEGDLAFDIVFDG